MGPRKKETTLTLRSGCTGAGGEKNRVDTHTSKRLRHRRGARKIADTHTSHRLCWHEGAEKKEMTLALRSGCSGAGEPGEKRLTLTLGSGCVGAGA